MNMKHEGGRFSYYVDIPRYMRILIGLEFTIASLVVLLSMIYSNLFPHTSHEPNWIKVGNNENHSFREIATMIATLFVSGGISLWEIDNHLSGKRETVEINKFKYLLVIAFLIVGAVSILFLISNTIRGF